MVSRVKAEAAHSRPEDGLSVLNLRGRVRIQNLLSAGRENVTVSPVYRGPVTTWWCIQPGPARVRLP